ncbi:NAD-dependent epimerase/dehydratase family protein, partial [bacterium]|nr:NAD-dependent epimerase/dehydratase family protein [bacterium]
MKVLVLGAGGMAGHVVATHFREQDYDVETISSTKPVFGDTTLLDVTNQDAFSEYLEGRDYSAIVNCIGILVKQSEEQKDLSTYLNSYLPHMLEARYRNTATKIIHLSTDCVFSGKNAPYTEDAPYDGELFYDRTKALGEIKNDKDLTLRMSIIGPDLSPSGTGLFNWFMSQSGNINGYSKSIWNGITTIELAKAIEEAIAQDVTGLYHLVPSGNISK